jgi:hypothetical protein
LKNLSDQSPREEGGEDRRGEQAVGGNSSARLNSLVAKPSETVKPPPSLIGGGGFLPYFHRTLFRRERTNWVYAINALRAPTYPVRAFMASVI